MKRSISIFTTALAALGLSFNVLAEGEFSDQPWHLVYQIGGAEMDNARGISDSDFWDSFGFGYFLNDSFSLDLEWDDYEGDLDPAVVDAAVPGATDTRWTLRAWSLNGRYYFGDGNWRPYLLGGLGIQKHTSVLHQDSNMAFNYGSSPTFGAAGQWGAGPDIGRQ